jgi:CheY-like chemotaxis protein
LAQKILLADDSVTAQNMGRRILSEAGYEVITVNNGSAALKKIAELKPDLIILDIYMPGYGGLEVCQRVKDDPETARIPVLLTVGKLEPFRADEARKVHADAHLVKPFEASELLTALAKLEDKIVPRAEPRPEPRQTGASGKSSTAAQQNASTRAADFGDKTSGWKSRLAIPGLSKRSEPEKPALAKTGFRDFQRVEDQGSAEAPAPAATPARTVQDITAEEMAAISAAAAALKEKASLAESELAAGAAGVEDSAPSVAATPEVIPEPVVEVPSPPEDQPAVALEAAIVGDADQKREIESLVDRTSAETQVQTAEEQAPVESVADTEVAAALESLAPSNGNRAFAEGFGDAEPVVHDRVEEPQEVPVGSVAASVGSGSSRWIAEEVPLAEDDAAFVLEREMQKVFAALAELKVEPESVANATSEAPSFSADADPLPAASAEPIDSPAEPNSVAAFGESHQEAYAASSEQPLQVAAETENNLASGSVELEPTVEATVSSEPYASQGTPLEVNEPAAAAEVEVVAVAEPVLEAQGTETPGTETQDTETQGVEVLGKTGESEPEHEAAEPVTMAVASESVAESQPEAAYAAAAAASAVASFRSIRPVETIPQSVPAPVDGGGAAAAEVPANGGPEREAELAAAWAQWRQIRDSIGSPSLASPAAEPTLAAEPASGFKDIQRPAPAQPTSHTASSESADQASIASIVDSMLAELRPKLVAEIARKMGQEKK